MAAGDDSPAAVALGARAVSMAKQVSQAAVQMAGISTRAPARRPGTKLKPKLFAKARDTVAALPAAKARAAKAKDIVSEGPAALLAALPNIISLHWQPERGQQHLQGN